MRIIYFLILLLGMIAGMQLCLFALNCENAWLNLSYALSNIVNVAGLIFAQDRYDEASKIYGQVDTIFKKGF